MGTDAFPATKLRLFARRNSHYVAGRRVHDSRAKYQVTRIRDDIEAVSRLEAFLIGNDILPVELARASGCSRQALLRSRRGRCEPTRRFMAAILGGVRKIKGAAVTISDLFDFDDGPYPHAKEEWRRTAPPGRPRRAGKN